MSAVDVAALTSGVCNRLGSVCLLVVLDVGGGVCIVVGGTSRLLLIMTCNLLGTSLFSVACDSFGGVFSI